MFIGSLGDRTAPAENYIESGSVCVDFCRVFAASLPIGP
jgi:hypothetical protein